MRRLLTKIFELLMEGGVRAEKSKKLRHVLQIKWLELWCLVLQWFIELIDELIKLLREHRK